MLRKLLTTVCLVICSIGGAALWLGIYILSPVTGPGERIVFIPKGSGLRTIQAILRDEAAVDADIRFLITAKLTGLSGRLKAGEYQLPANALPHQILQLLASGRSIRHRLTFPEGLTAQRIAEILARDGWVDQETFIALCGDPSLIRSLGLKQGSLEGYLFPDTYLLTRGEADEIAIISMMTQRFHAVWKEIAGEEDHPEFTPHQVVTLASIVEKETGAPGERPLIAGVFINRLQTGMKLQSDPTVIYGLAEFNGNLTKANLRTPTPYNTYMIKGMPAGPICNPGRASLEAVLHPSATPFLYFVSKNDGTHHFSASLKEHNRAVRTYQRSGQ
ncbi:MAG: endolytic transglycosylase MltG [Desulfobulbaceae bacterium]|nr:endolytic transglycosylase MltG [Desulfobulbaceae bacterium]